MTDNQTHIQPIRHEQAELLYYDFEWQLHLEFDKENIRHTGQKGVEKCKLMLYNMKLKN